MNIKKQINKFNVTYSDGNNEDVEIILPIESIQNLRAELDEIRQLFSTGEFEAATQVTVNGEYQKSWNADTKLDISVYNEEKTKYLLKEGNDTPFIITQDGYEGRYGIEYGDKYIKITYPQYGSAIQIMNFPDKYDTSIGADVNETFAMLSDISFIHCFSLSGASTLVDFAVWGTLPLKYREIFDSVETFYYFLMEKCEGVEISVTGYCEAETVCAMSVSDDGSLVFICLGGNSYSIQPNEIVSFTDNII